MKRHSKRLKYPLELDARMKEALEKDWTKDLDITSVNGMFVFAAEMLLDKYEND